MSLLAMIQFTISCIAGAVHGKQWTLYETRLTGSITCGGGLCGGGETHEHDHDVCYEFVALVKSDDGVICVLHLLLQQLIELLILLMIYNNYCVLVDFEAWMM
jgi:hypothetical protein